ncbi:hypothetical protein FRC03_000712 [Tulasnella sp. 419]|nr:hypothetical protein FRC03_000712 [Tulasnella sp. 419]
MPKHPVKIDHQIFSPKDTYVYCLICPGEFRGPHVGITPLKVDSQRIRYHSQTLKHQTAVSAFEKSKTPRFKELSNGQFIDQLSRKLTEVKEPLPEYNDSFGFSLLDMHNLESPSNTVETTREVFDSLKDRHEAEPSLYEEGTGFSDSLHEDVLNHTCLDQIECDTRSAESTQESPEHGERPEGCLLRVQVEDTLGEDSSDESEHEGSDFDPKDDPFTVDLTQMGRKRTALPVDTDCPTYPWPSQSMFLTDLLFNSPRLRFSEAQKRAILSWAKELNATDVPTLGALKKVQDHLRKAVGDPTEKVTSHSGDVFYLNDIGKAIAKDYANPKTRAAMQDYPEYLGGKMSQVFHGSKMLEDLPDHLLTPTARANDRIFWVNELLQCTTGHYFIPKRYIIYSTSAEGEDRELYAIGHDVEKTESGLSVSDELTFTPVSAFRHTYDEIHMNKDEWGVGFQDASQSYAKEMPHPFRKIAGDRMVYSVPLIIFMDDVSGNISKQWNKHHAVYISNANLPREVLEKEFFTRFITSSPHAPPMELMRRVQESIDKALREGALAYDSKYNEEVYLRLYDLFHGGDNPMQVEECSQAGLNCNHFCRTCIVGGTKEYKQSENGYEELFKTGSLRTPDQTAEIIRDQIVLCKLSGATEKIKRSVAATGVRDSSTATILNSIVNMGKQLRRRGASIQAKVTEGEAQELLQKELEKQKVNKAINPLIGAPATQV